MLACPWCGAALAGSSCGCGAVFGEEEGVIDAFAPAGDAALTAAVGAFYEETPFPAWRPEDDRESLLRAGRASPLTRWLDERVDPRARVVELGCGTGQLPLFLGLAGREVLGVDLSMASLREAERFRRRLGLPQVRFARGNLFRPPVARGSADLGISTGVLHHTADPRGGFAALCGLVRPGGLVVVGLYHRIGRLLLPLLRGRHRREEGARGRAWYRDQHEHPHESRHRVGEVLGWFAEEGLAFATAFPPIVLGGDPVEGEPGSAAENLLAELSWLGRAADGGLFVLVGRVPGVRH
jgi:SAM-dependent methyltransferase